MNRDSCLKVCCFSKKKETEDILHKHIFPYFRYLDLQSTVFFSDSIGLNSQRTMDFLKPIFDFSIFELQQRKRKHHRRQKFSLDICFTLSEISSLL